VRHNAIAALYDAAFVAEEDGTCREHAASPERYTTATAAAVARLYSGKPAVVVKTIAHPPKERLPISSSSFKHGA
jgi:hypothetical protein